VGQAQAIQEHDVRAKALMGMFREKQGSSLMEEHAEKRRRVEGSGMRRPFDRWVGVRLVGPVCRVLTMGGGGGGAVAGSGMCSALGLAAGKTLRRRCERRATTCGAASARPARAAAFCRTGRGAAGRTLFLSAGAMSSLAAARADNFYYPPDWTPKQGGLNKYHKVRERGGVGGSRHVAP